VLSVVLSTWNEEANIARVLQSVKNLSDEIVVVDTESTDATVEIAKKFGCKIYHHKNTGIVEPVRNFSIEKARGDWILLLDADEEISSELANYIKAVIKSDKADYYRIPRKNIIFGSWIKSDHWWPDYVYRLFRKGFISWDDQIHSIPITRGRGSDFPKEEKYAILHHNYATVSQYITRLDRYTNHQLSLLVDKQTPFSWTNLISKPMQEFLNQFFARSGYKEGIHGLILSGLQGFSEFVLYIKYWQYLGSHPESISLINFSSEVKKNVSQYQWWKYERLSEESSFLSRLTNKIARKISTFLTGIL
jgi:(heptosyl)LPS beta-1,4-glucosyltransferase